MPRPEIVLEAQQDYLLELGDDVFVDDVFPDVLRQWAQALGVFAEVTTWPLQWWLARYADATATATDVTPVVQDGDPASLVAVSSLVAGDGHVLGASVPFTTVRYVVLDPHRGGTPVYEYSTWDGAAWQPLTPFETPDFGQRGLQTLTFVAPDTWRVDAPLLTPDLLQPVPEAYWLRVRATIPPLESPAMVSALQVPLALVPGPSPLFELLTVLWYPLAHRAGSAVVLRNVVGDLYTLLLDTAHQVVLLPGLPPATYLGVPVVERVPDAIYNGIHLVASDGGEWWLVPDLAGQVFAESLAPSAPILEGGTGLPLVSTALTVDLLTVSILGEATVVLSLSPLPGVATPAQRELDYTPVAAALDLAVPAWRTHLGTPTHYLRDLTALPQVQVTPAVDTTLGPAALLLIATTIPEEPFLPSWLEGLLVWRLAAREARRLGATQDAPMADALEGLTQGLEDLLRQTWRAEGLEMAGTLRGVGDATPH